MVQPAWAGSGQGRVESLVSSGDAGSTVLYECVPVSGGSQ